MPIGVNSSLEKNNQVLLEYFSSPIDCVWSLISARDERRG